MREVILHFTLYTLHSLSGFWTSLIFKLACAATVAWLVALMYEKGFRPVRDVVDMFRRLPKVSRVLLGAFFVGM